MRFFFVILFLVLNILPSFADITDNIDFNFVDNAFSNPNPTTNKQFEDVMKQYETPREGVFTKIFKFFDKDKVKYDKDFKTKYENPNNQPRRIKDVPDEKPTVLVSVDSIDSLGNIINAGYYQVEYKKENEKDYLYLTQGNERKIATLYAKQIEEDEKATAVLYGRSENLNNGYIKIIYANLDCTLAAYLKIYEEEIKSFEPLY